MPKYRAVGLNIKRESHKEIVDAMSPKFALSVAYARGISATHPVMLEELDEAGEVISSTEYPAHMHAIRAQVPSELPQSSRLHESPISTIALGVFLGLVLFMLFTLLLSMYFGGNVHLNF